jgi:hypothetical protein
MGDSDTFLFWYFPFVGGFMEVVILIEVKVGCYSPPVVSLRSGRRSPGYLLLLTVGGFFILR